MQSRARRPRISAQMSPKRNDAKRAVRPSADVAKSSSKYDWSAFLVKTRVDDGVFDFDDSTEPEERQRIEDMRFLCGGVFTDSERIAKVRDKIKKLRSAKPRSEAVTEVAGRVLAELDAIQQDQGFAKSRRGKFVLLANDWGQGLYETLRADRRFDGLMVGPHADFERIVVTGEVHDPLVLAAAVELIAKYDSDALLEYRVLCRVRRND